MSNEFINLGSANNDRADFQLRYISISKYEGDWHSLPHTHQFSELFYVLRGEGVFYIEDEKVFVKTDDLIHMWNTLRRHFQITQWNILFSASKDLPFLLFIQIRRIRKDTATTATDPTKISLLISHS